jgi:hypothetical protein
MHKNIGLSLHPEGCRLHFKRNEEMTKHQHPKMQGLTFVRKSTTFILKENEKMVERTSFM